MQKRNLEYQNKIENSFKEIYKNKFEIPKFKKVIISVGIGKIRENEKIVEYVQQNIAMICGQKAVYTKSKKSISGFKVRAGEKVGLKVTLRGDKMYDFLSKLANVALPRLRDFRGLTEKSFDKSGNVSIGIKECIIFPELAGVSENIHGLQITITTTAKNDSDAKKLLIAMGFPFNKPQNEKESILVNNRLERNG